MMRIGYDTLVENPFNPSSGLDYLKLLLAALLERDDPCDYVALVSEHNRHLFDFPSPRLRLVVAGRSNETIGRRILSQQTLVPWQARRHGVDVLLTLNTIPLIRTCGTVVKTCGLHHQLLPEQVTPNRLRRLYRRVMFDHSARSADLVIANTEATRRQIVSLMHVPRERVAVVYEAVADTFKPMADTPALRAELRERYGIERDYLLFVSTLWRYKNPHVLVRAAGRLRRSADLDLDVVIVGADDHGLVPELQSIAREEGVDDRLRFTGKVANVELGHLYAGARVFVYPSRAETFGKPLVEAMRTGTPIVAANATCIPEVLGGAGLLAPPDDSDKMAEAIRRVATDESLRSRLRTAGLERSRRFSWAATAEATYRLVERVAATRRGERN
jgi:glycosyltransferase involved in cell wall biosynthesis